MGILDEAIREHLDLKRRRGADPVEVERLEREALGPVRRPGFEHDEDVLGAEYMPEVSNGDDAAEARYAAEGSEAYSGEAEPDWVEPGEEEPLFDEEHKYEPPQGPADEPPTATPRHHEIAEAWDAHEALHGPAVDDPMARPEPTDEPIEPSEPIPREEAAGPSDWGAPRQEREAPYEPDAGFEPAAPQPPAHAEGPAPEPGVPLAGTPPLGPAEPVPGERRVQHGDTLDEETAEFDVEADHDPHEQGAPHEEGAPDDMLEETPDFLQDTPEHDRLWFEQRPPRDFDFGK
jgi:hypothetical protein